MQPHRYLIAVMAFSLVVVVALSLTVDMSENYAKMGVTVDVDSTQSNTFNEVSEINERTESIKSSVIGSDVGSEDAAVTFLGAAWSAIQIMYSSLDASASLVQDVGNLFGIPPVIVTFLITAIVLAVIFTGIYMIFKSRGE